MEQDIRYRQIKKELVKAMDNIYRQIATVNIPIEERQNLSGLIEERGLSANNVRKQAGIKEGRFTYLMNDRAEPTLPEVYKLSNILGVSIYDIEWYDKKGEKIFD